MAEVVKKFPEDMDARTEYKLIKALSKKMSDAADSVIEVKAWIVFNDVDYNTGEQREVLTVETQDGEIFSTISSVFMREFNDIVKHFGLDVGAIRVIEGISRRSGRKYLTCTVD